MSLTEHGFKHADFTAKRAEEIAQKLGYNDKIRDLCLAAGFCHDIGNFLSRTYHHYLGSLLFSDLFKEQLTIEDLTVIMQAITNHDKEEMKFTSPVSAIVVIADKSDVRRNRVLTNGLEIQNNIHDRVNYAAIENKLYVNDKAKTITLAIKIDTKYVPIMEYFEIFTKRMNYCRLASNYLGYHFNLIINNFKLL